MTRLVRRSLRLGWCLGLGRGFFQRDLLDLLALAGLLGLGLGLRLRRGFRAGLRAVSGFRESRKIRYVATRYDAIWYYVMLYSIIM